jgi:hypothetical protein
MRSNGIDLGLHVAGQKAQVLARLDCRPREHDATDTLSRERVDGGRHGEIGLARSRRTDAHDDVVVLHLAQILGLPGRLGLDDRSNAGQRDPLSRDAVARAVLVAIGLAAIDCVAHAQHVVGRKLATLARRLHHACRDSGRSTDGVRRSDDGHCVAAQRDLHAVQPRQLDQIAVVDAGERQRIGALGRDFLCDGVVTHALSP